MKLLNRVKLFFIELINSADKRNHLIVNILFIILSLSLFLFNENKYFYIIWAIFSIFSLVLFLLLFFDKGIKIDIVALLSILLIFIMLFSNILNGWKSFNFTNILMVIMFNIFYQYISYINNPLKVLENIFISLILFSMIFTFIYLKELLSLDFKRLGGEIGNVNSVGFHFSIGYSIALYYLFFKKKRMMIVSLLLFAFLGLSTGSVKVVINMVALLLVSFIFFFGKKRWYFLVIGIGIMAVIFLIVINLSAFNFLKLRVMDVIDVLIGNGEVFGSAGNRFEMQKEGILFFSHFPLYGWGFNGYSRIGSFGTYSHNNYIELLVNFGVSGFTVFQFFIIYPFILSIKLIFNDEDVLEKKAFVLILGLLLIITQFGMVIIDSKISYLLIAFLSGNIHYNGANINHNLLSIHTFKTWRNNYVSNS